MDIMSGPANDDGHFAVRVLARASNLSKQERNLLHRLQAGRAIILPAAEVEALRHRLSTFEQAILHVGHHCHAFRCRVTVPPAMFMCKRHWFMLPKEMRDAVWREYQPGQEARKVAPTEAYFRVTDEAENYIAAKEGLPLPHPFHPPPSLE